MHTSLSLILFLDYPKEPGEDLIGVRAFFMKPLGILGIVISLMTILFLGFGYLYKSIQSKGLLRKKYLILSMAYIIYTICTAVDAFSPLAIIIFFARIGVLICFYFFYLGLREEPEKKVKKKSIKEIKVEGDLFRLIKRPDQITEEEVIFHREKMICLVCKGKVGKFMFMCPNCEAFYCDKCTYALIQSENACWVCNTPLLESKPIKLYKRDEEEVGVETSEKPQKKPKTKK